MDKIEREINIPNIDELIKFFKDHKDINIVYIFGSHGTDFENKNSDIDLAILFENEKPILNRFNLEADIEEIIQREVDILSLNKCNILLKYQVISDGQKIYEKEAIKTADFIENVLKEYFDFGVKLRQIKADFREGLREETCE